MRKSSPLHDLPALPAPPRFDEREGPIKVEADDSLSYMILGGPQPNDPNLSPLARALNHRFAVMFSCDVEERLFDVLGEIRDMGGLSPVKLVSVGEDSLYVVLDERTSSSTVQKVGSIWSIATVYQALPLKICFASESDIWSGRSDFEHLNAAKEIFDSNLLGVWPAPGVRPKLEVVEQSALVHPHPSLTPERPGRLQCPVAPMPEHVLRNLGHSACAMTEYYLKSGAEFGHEQRKKLLAQIVLSSGLRQEHLASVTTSNFNHRPSDHISDHTGV